jgi:uncharacterized protein YbjT (DUF2867 family)
MVAVIVGSTGLVGSALVQKLLGEKAIKQVLSVSRKSLNIHNPRLTEILISDLSELASKQESLRGDLYFCTLGTTIKSAGSKDNFRKVDYEAIVEFARIAKHNDSRAFVLVSSMGADPSSPFFYNQVKGETEQAVKSLQLVSVSLFRPGLLVGERKESRPAEEFFLKTITPLKRVLPEAFVKKIATNVETLADAMLKRALKAAPGVEIIPAAKI